MRQRLSFESFNLVGSVCSLIALLLTASDKLGIANFVQITFGVLLGISVGGLVMMKILNFYRTYLNYTLFFTKCIFGLFSSIIVALIALVCGQMGYWIMDMLIVMVVVPIFKYNRI